MKWFISIALVLALIAFLVLDISTASNYAFGTKVASNDSDLGRLLKNIPDGTMVSFWDIGPNLGAYDSGDVLYLDMPPVGTANANDLRLTRFSDHPAGTKVTPSDQDMNAPLESLATEIRFLNLNGSQTYDLYDAVYLHQSNSLNLGNADSAANGNEQSGYSATTSAPLRSNTAANIANINPDNPAEEVADGDHSDDGEGHSQGNTDGLIYQDGDYAASKGGFWERLPYTGCCDELPRGSVCLVYSDNFVWPVSDLRIDGAPFPVGYDDNGLPIEAIRCNAADYYHILGTSFVKSVPRQKTLYIQSAPIESEQNAESDYEDAGDSAYNSASSSIQSGNTGSYTGNNPENIGNTGGSYPSGNGMDKIISAMNQINTNSDLIHTNDVRLTQIGRLAPGTKVLNFDPDLNKLVALPVLVSFPKKPEDYACIRVYDANGNGLYDAADDVYLDASFPGSSTFGAVSINNVRLSRPYP